MATTPAPIDPLAFDPGQATRVAVNAARVGLGILGVTGTAIGIALLVWPTRSLVVVGAFVGAFFVVSGAVRALSGIFVREAPAGLRILSIVTGLLLLLGGIVALRNLTAATAVLTLIVVILIGVGWIVEGITALLQAGNAQSRAWAYFTGIISIVAGAVVVVVPTWSALVLLVFTGVTLIVIGLATITQAFRLGKNLPPSGQETVMSA